MTKKSKEKIKIEHFILDLSNAILPNNWPQSIPLLLPIETGKHEKDFDISISLDGWYLELKDFVSKSNYKKNEDLPIGINKSSLLVGSKIIDKNGEVIALGKDREEYEKKINLELKNKENILIDLREKFPKIKDEYLIDFNETQEMLLSVKRPILGNSAIHDVFNDILLSGGGSTYKESKTASLGAYNSVLNFEVLEQTLNLFKEEELNVLKGVFDSLSYLTPIHNIINTYLNNFISKLGTETTKFPKIKV